MYREKRSSISQDLRHRLSPLQGLLVLVLFSPSIIQGVSAGVISRNSTTKDLVNNTSDSRFGTLLFLAQEEAKCLAEYGGKTSLDKKTLDYETFTNFLCLNTSKKYEECEQCRSMTSGNLTGPMCQELCTKKNGTCAQSCSSMLEKVESLRNNGSFLSQLDNVETTGLSRNCSSRSSLSQEFCLEPPTVLCEDTSIQQARNNAGQAKSTTDSSGHIVVLKWAVRLRKGSDKPIVFVLEGREVSSPDSEWKTYFKTTQGVNTVEVPFATATFRWRVTAVGPNGVIDRASSKDLPTLNGFIKPEPPKRIFIVKEVVKDGSVDILVGWDPPDVRPCFYKVTQTHQDSEGKQNTQRISVQDRQEGLTTWFTDLNLTQTYDVRITSRRGKWDGPESSNFTSLLFTMPSCHKAHNYRFDKCVPTPPRNISQDEVIIVEEHKGEGTGRVRIRWLPPLHAAPNNSISKYYLYRWPADNYNSKLLNHSFTQSNIIPPLVKPESIIHLEPNETEYVLQNLSLNRRYTIALVATSTKGNSSRSYLTISTAVAKYVEVENTTLQNSILLSIPIICMICAVFACHFIRIYYQKHQVKLARNQYFQSMDERDHSADWSIVPLNEDSSSLKLFNDAPKEKWEISYDNLIMGEVIGQGAFGVVRRAKLSRHKILIAAGKYAAQFGESNVDEDGMETVAVKMLKVSATRDDRDQLIKEIVTMQNLGVHPQIVSLLGACTKGRSLCLVLEYCPGGDLLSFLRKVRSRYWPTLGLSDAKRSQSDTSLQSAERRMGLMRNSVSGDDRGKESSKETSTSTSSRRKSTDSSPINYADIGGFSDASISSPEKTSPSATTVLIHEYGNGSITGGQTSVNNMDSAMNQSRNSFDLDEDCRPIDEKDILSYARQISMGMEYLEKNRVVHRDLAGRNVLLLGDDFKQVKISDFGLSRDIYTWNVYHQKSNGKLPIKWMSIESIFTHVFTTKSDVWSFGILLWELVTLGGTPYPGLGNTELFHLLKSGYRMERPDNCSEEIYALMKKCWRTAPAARPNFTELRRYLETMLEAAEPNLYLSLMADLPTDYFQLGSRGDLLPSKTDDFESPGMEIPPPPYPHYTAESIKSTNSGNNNSVFNASSRQRKTNLYHPSTAKPPPLHPKVHKPTENRRTSCPNRNNDSVSMRRSTSSGGVTPRSDDPLHNSLMNRRRRQRSQSSSRKSRNLKIQDGPISASPGLHMSNSLQSMESLVSPDSGFPRSDGNAGDTDDEDEETSPVMPLDPLQERVQRFPVKPQHSITIIENKTYGIRD